MTNYVTNPLGGRKDMLTSPPQDPWQQIGQGIGAALFKKKKPMQAQSQQPQGPSAIDAAAAQSANAYPGDEDE